MSRKRMVERDYIPLDLTEDEQLKLAILISNAEDSQTPTPTTLHSVDSSSKKKPQEEHDLEITEHLFNPNDSSNCLIDSADLEVINQQFELEQQIATKVEVMDELHLSTLSESVRKILLEDINSPLSSEVQSHGEGNIFTDDVLNEIFGDDDDVNNDDYGINNGRGEVDDEFDRISDLQNREITEEDYNTLLTLNEIVPPVPKFVPKVDIHSITMVDHYNDTFTHKECMICLDDFEEKEEIYLIHSCLHPFHLPCLTKWFAEKYECPICRITVIQTL